MYIRKSIKFIKSSAGLNHKQMAAKLGVSKNELRLLEDNCTKATDLILEKLSSVFHIPASFILWEAQMPTEGVTPEFTSKYKQIRSTIHELQHLRIAQNTGA